MDIDCCNQKSVRTTLKFVDKIPLAEIFKESKTEILKESNLRTKTSNQTKRWISLLKN